MKIFLLSLSVFISVTVFAQAPAIQWQKSLGGTSNDEGVAIAATSDGGSIMAGGSRSTDGDVTGNHGNSDGWIVKLTATGSIQWQKSLGGSGDENFTAISQTTDGGYILAGYSNSLNGDVTGNHGDYDYWVVKLNSSGLLEWQKSIGGSNRDIATSISETPGGGYILGGGTSSTDGDATGNNGYNDALIVKLSKNGIIEWKRVIGYNGYNNVYVIKPVPAGGYICVGESTTDGWMIKFDNNGILQWQKKYGGTEVDRLYSVSIAADGGYIAAGTIRSNNGDATGHHGATTSDDAWVIKTDTSGNVQWHKSLGGARYDFANSVYTTTDGNYVIAGSFGFDGTVPGFAENYDYWIVKLNPSGGTIWQKTLGGTHDEIGGAVIQVADDGYLMVGNSSSNDSDVIGHHGNVLVDDAWLVKFYPEGAKYITVTATPGMPVCPGTPVTFTATASATGTYQWKKNNVNVGTNSAAYKDSTLQNGDTVLCTLTVGDSVFTSNAIGIKVTTPSITIIGPSVLCAGNTATYKATAALAGHPISYQWLKNNVNVGTNSNLYTDNHINDGDSIWCNIITDAGCTAGAGLTSNKIVVKTLAYGTVTATVTYNPYNYKLCAPGDTTSVTFHAVGEYGGANPSFQWVLNNNVVGTDTSFYTANGVKAGDKIYCRYTSSQKCVTGDVHSVQTNIVTLTTKATLTPSITIMQTPDTAVCAGTKVRFKISSLQGGGENPIYQWMKNNVPVGTNSDVYYDSTLANNDNVWCKMISHHPCLTAPATVISNKKKVKVDDTLPPQPSVISGPSSVTSNQAGINYSVSTLAAVTYLWSIPADAGFVTDKHNSSVTVNWGSTAGNIVAQTRNGCGYSAKRVLAVHVVPSLLNASQSSQSVTTAGKAVLYPNPAKNFATVSFTAAEAGKYMVQVTDAQGRILQVKETNATKGRNTININVSSYAKGSYFVRLSNKDGRQEATFTLVVAK